MVVLRKKVKWVQGLDLKNEEVCSLRGFGREVWTIHVLQCVKEIITGLQKCCSLNSCFQAISSIKLQWSVVFVEWLRLFRVIVKSLVFSQGSFCGGSYGRISFYDKESVVSKVFCCVAWLWCVTRQNVTWIRKILLFSPTDQLISIFLFSFGISNWNMR